MTKIKVLSSSLKKEGTGSNGPWKIHSIETEAHGTVDTFDTLEIGQEYEGDIIPNPPYNPQFKLHKQKNAGEKKFTRDYTFEKKRCALECAVQMVVSNKVTSDQLTATRDKFFDYLNS